MQFVLCMYLDFENFFGGTVMYWSTVLIIYSEPCCITVFMLIENVWCDWRCWQQQKQLLKIAGPSYVSVFHVFTSGLRIKSLSDICQSWNRRRWMYTLSVAWMKMRFFHVFHSQHNPVFFQPVFSLTGGKKKKVLHRSALDMRISFM